MEVEGENMRKKGKQRKRRSTGELGDMSCESEDILEE